MELRRLRYFLTLADELNFRRAAEKLNIAQSPLSQQIRKLEEEVGVRLFDRSNRHVALTHAGQIFLVEARAVLARSREAVERARSAAEGHAGMLKVGYLTSMTDERFSRAMTAFREECPEVDLALFDLVPEAILAALRDRVIDVGFIRAPFRDEQLLSQRIWQEKLMVALPKNHWLAGRPGLAPKYLADETFIMVPDHGSMGLNEVIRTMCLNAGFTPRRRIEANQMQAAIWLVHIGFGISVVPSSLQGLHRDNVVYQPIEGSPSVSAYMVWRKDNHSTVVARFREIVNQQVKRKR
ncbi:MAG: LysR family transcriptional regulator [Verrucomicrobia bacterium]|nr:LysR family transcriptional regulator [Verrucomicrobiota bacterium]